MDIIPPTITSGPPWTLNLSYLHMGVPTTSQDLFCESMHPSIGYKAVFLKFCILEFWV